MPVFVLDLLMFFHLSLFIRTECHVDCKCFFSVDYLIFNLPMLCNNLLSFPWISNIVVSSPFF